MNCDQFQGLYELYALGLLEETERTLLAEHLQHGCTTCYAELKRAAELNAMVSEKVPLVNPPARLRRRIANSFGDPAASAPAWNGQWAYWALAGATILALTVGLDIQNSAFRSERNQARAASVQLARMSDAVKIMQATGTKELPFGKGASTAPSGKLFVHRYLGIALVADRLPHAPAGWKYESWVVPNDGVPQPVESFQPDESGQAVTVIPGPVRTDEWKAVAVSMEPENAQPTKPTKVVLAAPLNAKQS